MTREEKNAKIKATYAATMQRRKSQMCRVFQCKVDESRLTDRQCVEIKMMFVEAKRLWNHILNWSEDEKNDIFKFATKDCWETITMDKDGKLVSKPLHYIGGSVKQALHKQMCSNIKTIAKLKKQGYQTHGGHLRYKAAINSLHFKIYKGTHKFHGDNKIQLQRVSGKLRIKRAGQFLHQKGIEIADCRLVQKATGLYVYVTTYIAKELLEKKEPTKGAIGIDFGCKDSFTLSDGRKIDVKIEETERMKRLQNKLSRQVKRSNNYNRTRHLLGVEHQKVVNRKDDAANKFVASLKEHTVVAIQDEQLQNWHRGGHGKAVQHSILRRVKAKIIKMPNAVVLDKFIPTTKFCRHCGESQTVKLWDRTVTCCGITEDRDIHAAQNIEWIATTLCQHLVRRGPTEIKRAEFEEALKSFDFNANQMLKHEAARSLVAQ